MRTCLFILLIIILTACAQAPGTFVDQNISVSVTPSSTLVGIVSTPSNSSFPTSTSNPVNATETSAAESALVVPTPTQTLVEWTEMPVIPTVSDTARSIYVSGLAMGNEPRSFIKVGDCDATTSWFLGDFDLDSRHYSLGDYHELQETIDYFQGSFGRESVAVKRGFNTASVLSPIWADPTVCEKNETPLDCEIRLRKPSYALILLGTNDVHKPSQFEPNLRKILDHLIEKGVLPILSTKADNREGDHTINATLAKLAYEYDIPLWNFWLAVQHLPAHGLQEDGSHLTFASNQFDDPFRMKSAWPWRNLTALQTLDAIRKGLAE